MLSGSLQTKVLPVMPRRIKFDRVGMLLWRERKTIEALSPMSLVQNHTLLQVSRVCGQAEVDSEMEFATVL